MGRGGPGPGADVGGVSPVQAQVLQGRVQSRCRCGHGRVQSRCRCGHGRAQSRCRCGRGRAQSWCRCGPALGSEEALEADRCTECAAAVPGRLRVEYSRTLMRTARAEQGLSKGRSRVLTGSPVPWTTDPIRTARGRRRPAAITQTNKQNKQPNQTYSPGDAHRGSSRRCTAAKGCTIAALPLQWG